VVAVQQVLLLQQVVGGMGWLQVEQQQQLCKHSIVTASVAMLPAAYTSLMLFGGGLKAVLTQEIASFGSTTPSTAT
jgi:hypothetical protein